MLGKLLFWILLGFVVWLAFKATRKHAARNADAARGSEDMVRCLHCGVHLPQSESVGAGGKFFCSEEHLRLHR